MEQLTSNILVGDKVGSMAQEVRSGRLDSITNVSPSSGPHRGGGGSSGGGGMGGGSGGGTGYGSGW